MTARLERFAPEASEPLRLAARCQHIQRWKIPRPDYSMDRIGYLQWRKRLQKFHAELAGKILRDVGYDEDTVARGGADAHRGAGAAAAGGERRDERRGCGGGLR
jgi:hypothetical protein